MYQEDPAWDDIIPLPQDDGDKPLAQIAYTEEYAEAMSYLRAIMAKEEYSARALAITEHITEMNPAHYTVWLYRAKCIFALSHDLRQEIAYLNNKALRHEKNYQIWHHRQLIMDKLGDPTGEAEFVAKMFEKDSKNYHVWSYRQWLVRRFELWEGGELEYVDKLLAKDIRNNSAWNHRFFVVFGRGGEVDMDVVEREIKYAEDAIYLAPQNQSPWNYLRGLISRAKLPLSKMEALCKHYAPVDNPDRITSSHGLDWLADIGAEKPETKDTAIKALELLAKTYDPIRTNYWNHRKVLLQKAVA
ncbi:hypothetical protein BZA05DRAFT_400472 [Tricharina praecox]|uniref:uncharacterized protein n=1 Tax=Tricharina praecox TaxID=43433 RepID=UPI00221F2BE7|nr:uncharacterized protein BZA05DRAFT_400472 [Tricharina praecox]KAI5849976.1 hypothetical protein BZA05DRAFT_400472 [Tricharina praecox]